MDQRVVPSTTGPKLYEAPSDQPQTPLGLDVWFTKEKVHLRPMFDSIVFHVRACSVINISYGLEWIGCD